MIVAADSSVAATDEPGLGGADLSPWFNPFLEYFARDTQRCGGTVRIFREKGEVQGLLIVDPVERVASVFTRSAAIAGMSVRERGPVGMFSDVRVEPTAEPFDIFERTLETNPTPVRFRHRVRAVTERDLPNLRELMHEVYGAVNDRWFVGVPNRFEMGFTAEVDGRLAGVGWVTRVGQHARLHSLTVRVPFRRMGLGSALLSARLWWAQENGARTVLSEIARENAPSRAIAERAGMHHVGEIYFHRSR